MMPSITTSSLGRYRPVVFAISVLAAGYTIYYIHSNFEALTSPRRSNPPLHRRNAVHRRTQRRNTLQAVPDAPPIRYSIADVVELYRDGPSSYGPFVVVAEGGHWEMELSEHHLRQLESQLQRHHIPDDDGRRMRDAFEFSLFTSFLTSTFPWDAMFGDEDDPDPAALLLALQSVTQVRPEVMVDALAAFRSGSLAAHPISVARALEGAPIRDPTQLRELQAEARADRMRSPPLSPMRPSGRPDTVAGNESEHSWSPEDDHDGSRREGLNLLNLLYHIAEHQAQNEGYVHRSVTCNSCGVLPIRGIRYRCTNCADYDLCEQCEAAQVHPKTHLFYKVRIPAPFLGNPRQPQPVWYPGTGNGHLQRLTKETRAALCELSGFEFAEMDALWEQFKCLAATEWPEGPRGFQLAIDRRTFDQCFVPSASIRPPPPNLIYDRMFYFYDTNGDGFIGFEEFVMGLSSMKSKNQGERIKRMFKGYDLDGDGYVNRKDFLYMLRAYYALTKELIRDVVVGVEEDILDGSGGMRAVVYTSQPLSSAYNGLIVRPEGTPPVQGKVPDAHGDLAITEGVGIVRDDDADRGDHQQLIGDRSEKLAMDTARDRFHDADGSMILDGGDRYDPDADELRRLLSLDGNATAAEQQEFHDSMDRYLSQPSGEDDSLRRPFSTHPRLRSPSDLEDVKWPPDYASAEDVLSALRHALPLQLITDPSHRAQVLEAAMTRIARKEAREHGIAERWKRRQFYIDEENGQASPDRRHSQVGSHGDDSGSPRRPGVPREPGRESSPPTDVQQRMSTLAGLQGPRLSEVRAATTHEVLTRSLAGQSQDAADAFTDLLFVLARQDFDAATITDVLSKRLDNRTAVARFVHWFSRLLEHCQNEAGSGVLDSHTRRSRLPSRSSFEGQNGEIPAIDRAASAASSRHGTTRADGPWNGEVPGPEKAVGKELLYQMTQETLNQILDPLFKDREDLAMEVKATASERQRLRAELSDPNKRKLAQACLADREKLWRTSESLPLGEQNVSAANDLRRTISEEHRVGSTPWFANLAAMLRVGLLTKAYYTPSAEELAYFHNLSGQAVTESLVVAFRKEYCAADADGAGPVPKGNSSKAFSAAAPALHVSMADMEKEVRATCEARLQERLAQRMMEQAGVAPADRMANDAQSRLEETLRNDRASFDTAIINGVFTIGASTNGASTNDASMDAAPTDAAPSDPEPRDPTLPQYRPNAPASGLNSTVTTTATTTTAIASSKQALRAAATAAAATAAAPPAPSHDDHLKFLMMLDCLEEDDLQRGGPGKLSGPDFEEVMRCSKGMQLAFLGSWIELASF